MSLVVTDFDGVIVVNVTGEDCSQVWKAVETQVKDGRQAVVVDLAQVPFLNSVNIAALIAVRNKLAANGGPRQRLLPARQEGQDRQRPVPR